MKPFYIILFTFSCLFSSVSYGMATRKELSKEQYEQLKQLIAQRKQLEVQSFLQEHNINERHRLTRIQAHQLLPAAAGVKKVDTAQFMRAQDKITDPVTIVLLATGKCLLSLICINNAKKLEAAAPIAHLTGISLYAKGLLEVYNLYQPSDEKKRIEERQKHSVFIFELLKKVSQSRCPNIYVDGIPYEIDIVRSGNMDNFTLNILPKLNPSRPRHVETLLYAARLQDAANLIHREETLTKKRIGLAMLNVGLLYGKLLALGLPKMPFPEPSYNTNLIIQKLPGTPFVEKGIGRGSAAALLTAATSGTLGLVGGELPPTVKKIMRKMLFEEVTDVTEVGQAAYAKLQEMLGGRPSLTIVKKLEDYMRDNEAAFKKAWQRECDQEHAAVATYVQRHPIHLAATEENKKLKQQRDTAREQLSREIADEEPPGSPTATSEAENRPGDLSPIRTPGRRMAPHTPSPSVQLMQRLNEEERRKVGT